MSIVLSLSGQPGGIASRVEKSKYESFILVVPTKRRIRHLFRELLQKHGGALPELPVFTLGTLAARFIAKAFEGRRLVDEAIQALLFNQALLDARGKLSYFRVRDRAPALPLGTFDKITNVIRKLKETGITPAALQDELSLEEPDEHAKLRDIITIYSAYEQRLESVHGVDAEGMFQLLAHDCSAQLFHRTFRHLFPHAEEIAIVGFDEFTEPEIGFIQKLCSLSIPVSLEFDFEQGNSALFGHLEQNYRRFLELGFRHVPAAPREEDERHDSEHTQLSLFLKEPPAPTRENIMRHLVQTLFKRDVEKRFDCTSFITVAKAHDRVREVQLICSLVKDLLLQRPDRDPSRICVAMYRPQLYTHLLREQCKKYGIPANITDRFELAQAPVIAAIISLLSIPARDFHRDDVLQATGSSYFTFNPNGKDIDAANLMNVSRDARIIGGRRAWHTRIERQMHLLTNTSPDNDSERDRRRRIRELEHLQHAQQDIRLLEDLLHDIGLEQTPAEFRKRVHQLLQRLQLPQNIVAHSSGRLTELVEKDARAYAKFLEIVDHTVHLLEFQEGKQHKHPLRTYLDHLKVALAQERYNVREHPGQGVLFTSIEETRGLPIDVMIVAGLVDGEFPSVYQSELFFSNRRLKEREQRHRWENRYLFYQAISNWTEHLYLTYPEQDGDLDLVPSSFIEALRAVASVEEWEYPQRSPLSGTAYSPDELLYYLGKSLSTETALPVAVPPHMHEKLSFVQHALAVERSRVDRHDLPEYEGYLLPALSDETKQYLQSLKESVYSISQLESYAKCPYQFFAERLLRVHPVEELEEELSPLERGSLLHEILFEFYTERRARDLPPMPQCTNEQFAEAQRRLVEIAEQKLHQLDIPDAFWELEKELLLGDKNAGRGLLHEFLEFERSRTTSLRPQYFEVAFGMQSDEYTRVDPTFSSDEPIRVGNVFLRGKIDRVELDDQRFAVIDYKTGSRLPTLDEIRQGISLQLPLYLYTIEQLLHHSRTPAGGAYYVLRPPVSLKLGLASKNARDAFGTQKRSTAQLPDDDELRAMIDAAIAHVNQSVNAIAEGKFPLTEPEHADTVCTYCDYKKMCRIQTIRHLTKSSAEES